MDEEGTAVVVAVAVVAVVVVQRPCCTEHAAAAALKLTTTTTTVSFQYANQINDMQISSRVDNRQLSCGLTLMDLLNQFISIIYANHMSIYNVKNKK